MISRITSIKRHTALPETPASVKQSFVIGDTVAQCGNENLWKINSCTKNDSKQDFSILIFDKRNVDKIYRSKKKEYLFEMLRREIDCLHEFQHNYVLQLVSGVHENSDYLMFITEPICCCLTGIIDKRESLPISAPEEAKTRTFTSMEVILGLYQLVEALRHLHITHGVIHGNITPNNVIINSHNQWKLSGLGFCVKISEKGKSHNYTWNPKQGKYSQPDLNYLAPEIQLKNNPVFQSDIFSLGLLICSIYNEGYSLMECSKNLTMYSRKLDELRAAYLKLYSKIPPSISDTVLQMLSRVPSDRPEVEELREMDCFKDSLILSLDTLFSLDGKSMNERKDFFNLFLKLVTDYSDVLQYQRILPILMKWFRFSPNLSSFVLPSILTMIYKSNKPDFEKYLYYNLEYILTTELTSQTTCVLLDLLELYVERLDVNEITGKIIPIILKLIDNPSSSSSSSTNSEDIQINTEILWNSLSVIQTLIGSCHLRNHVLMKIFQIFNKEKQALKIRVVCLECINQILDDLEPKDLTSDIIPFLTSIDHSQTQIYLGLLAVYKHIFTTRNTGIPFKILAKKILPPLIPQSVNPTLKADEFLLVMHVLRKMLDKIERDRCNQLNIESVRSNSGSLSSIGRYYSSSNINSNSRVLPLIAMQQPTMEIDYGSQNSFNSRATSSRRGSNVSAQVPPDYRRGSSDSVHNSRRNSALLNRLKSNNSETHLYPARVRRGSAMDSSRNWSKTSSNPAFMSQLSNGNSRESIQSNNSNHSMYIRRLSGNTTPYASQQRGLVVPSPNQYPRRHSYESSHNASINSLITASICEGPFISPSNSRVQSRRTSAQSLGPQVIPGNTARRLSTSGNRKLSFNAFSDTLINLFQ